MKSAVVRISERTMHDLENVVYANYPNGEHATLLRCGWAEGVDRLTVTIHSIVTPKAGDVEGFPGRVELNEPYSLRAALETNSHPFAVGLVHSHPEDYRTFPSRIDDDMDDYYASYFGSFTPDRPYVSFILSRADDGTRRFSGRIFLKGQWLVCSHLQVVGERVTMIESDNLPKQKIPSRIAMRLERITGLVGQESARRLWRTRVGIIGAGGTGSAVFDSLLRSGVGTIVIVDPDILSPSNAERFHGFLDEYIDNPISKVEALRRYAKKVNPLVTIITIEASASREDARRTLIGCDFIFGCSDSQGGRVDVADLAMRFLIPSIHMAVAMESDGKSRLTSEVFHLTQLGPGLPCPYCRSQVDSKLLSQELMSPQERAERMAAAEQAEPSKREQYWKTEPVIPTAGNLTTIAAEFAVTYGTGMLAGTHEMPMPFIEIDILRPKDGALDMPLYRRPTCICAGRDGIGGQGVPWIPASPAPNTDAQNVEEQPLQETEES